MTGLPLNRLEIPSSSQGVGVRSSVGAWLAVALIILLVLAPMPLGSNRPFFWSLNAVLVGVIGLVYALSATLGQKQFRVSISREFLIVGLWVVLIGYLIFQSLPIGRIIGPISFPVPDGGTLNSQSLSLAPGATAHMVIRVLTYGMFFFLILQAAANRTRARIMMAALFFIICLYAAYGLLALTQLGDPLLFFEKWAYSGSATATFVNRNSYATFLAFGMVSGVVLSLRSFFSGQRHRGSSDGAMSAALSLAGTVLIGSALLATHSRMGLFAALIGCALCAIIAGFKRRASHRFAMAGALALILAMCLFVVSLFGTGTLERLGSTEADTDVRFQLYGQILAMIAQRPLLGYGGGAFELAYPLFHELPVSPDRVWDRAHSTYLALWSELGVILGTLPLLIVALLGWRCAKLVIGRQHDWHIPLIAIGVLAVAAIHSLVDFSLEIQANTLYFLAFMGMGFSEVTRENGQ